MFGLNKMSLCVLAKSLLISLNLIFHPVMSSTVIFFLLLVFIFERQRAR